MGKHINYNRNVRTEKISTLLRLPYSLSKVFSYQPVNTCRIPANLYINGKRIKFYFINEFHKRMQELYFRSNAFAFGGPKSRKIQFPPPLVTLIISAQFACKKRAGNVLFIAWLVF